MKMKDAPFHKALECLLFVDEEKVSMASTSESKVIFFCVIIKCLCCPVLMLEKVWKASLTRVNHEHCDAGE